MAYDLVFDPILRDLVFAENGDIAVTDSQSVISTQNGTVILEARCMNILFPAFGIGYNSQILGGDSAQAAFQLNRWVSQISQDNGNGRASWKRKSNPPNIQFDFEASVRYNF